MENGEGGSMKVYWKILSSQRGHEDVTRVECVKTQDHAHMKMQSNSRELMDAVTRAIKAYITLETM